MRPEEKECRVSVKVSVVLEKQGEKVLGTRLQVWPVGRTGSVLFMLLSKSARGSLLMRFLP